MAKKTIDAATAKTLKNLGINATTEEEAHKKLVMALEREGIEGMEDESLATLIDMADGFLNENSTDDEEDDIEELDDEVEDLDDEEDDDEEEGAYEKQMDELAAEVKAEEGGDDDEDDDEEEVVELKKVKKAKKVKDEQPKVRKATKRGLKLDPKNIASDREVLDGLRAMFSEDYMFDWLKTFGVTVKHIGKNGRRGVISLENLVQHNDGKVTCNLFLLIMAKQTEVLDELGIEYYVNSMNFPSLKCVTLEEVQEIVEKIRPYIEKTVIGIDKRLGTNRKKMEENLKKKTTKK